MDIGCFIIIGISIVFSFCYLLYIHIMEKRLEKAILELKREQERMKLLKKSWTKLKDVMSNYEKSN